MIMQSAGLHLNVRMDVFVWGSVLFTRFKRAWGVARLAATPPCQRLRELAEADQSLAQAIRGRNRRRSLQHRLVR